MRCPRCGRQAITQVLRDAQGVATAYVRCAWGCGAVSDAILTGDPEEMGLELRRNTYFEEPAEPEDY